MCQLSGKYGKLYGGLFYGTAHPDDYRQHMDRIKQLPHRESGVAEEVGLTPHD